MQVEIEERLAAAVAHILVIEDEVNVGLTLCERLRFEGYDVAWAKSVAAAKDLSESKKFDIALIDVGLPDGDGFSIAQHLRLLQSRCALVFLTAMADAEHRIRGLELGAEDYITKPFHFKELTLRLRNVLKRIRYVSDPDKFGEMLKIGQATFELAKFEAQRNGQRYSLTHKECAVLKFLIERRGRVVSRDEILNFVWSDEEFPTPRTVDNFVMRLRKLIEDDLDQPQLIRSIRGVGYQLV